jgi:hypothetical protein
MRSRLHCLSTGLVTGRQSGTLAAQALVEEIFGYPEHNSLDGATELLGAI